MIELYEMLAAGIVDIIYAAIGIIALKVFMPWMQKTLLPWLDDKRLWALIKKFVAAAEKSAESGFIESKDKKSYVIDLLKARGIEITPEVNAFIEAAVEQLDLDIESGIMVFPDIFDEEIILEYEDAEDPGQDEVEVAE